MGSQNPQRAVGLLSRAEHNDRIETPANSLMVSWVTPRKG
jgi:hypothetical protein